ncbi:type II toxin-antitoxin system VapC family toxin [Wenzhouxiangella sp. XN79A]|uniref:type II toxin-antitoxin system VapC family toxin n=1 Tax=Wenzhouxiangella sp. XN79A TaxID=2724193 RepID=UPI00144A622F|nr:type II toxin-antitoxin system VapC family toxin [Wenzhouxiangella sp. XN79A]NKI33858.1 type II toxin-antitoxin system VapC family toxin [Wenzhouxiangella sp. XN79A]
MGVLIDTCIWIDVEQGRLHPEQVSAVSGNRPVYLSPVTLAELRLGAELAPDAGVRQKRLRAWRRMNRKSVIPIDAGTAEVFGERAAHLAADGKRRHRTRVQDLWIASQAVQHGLELMTRNPRDFQHIPGVDLIGPAAASS